MQAWNLFNNQYVSLPSLYIDILNASFIFVNLPLTQAKVHILILYPSLRKPQHAYWGIGSVGLATMVGV